MSFIQRVVLVWGGAGSGPLANPQRSGCTAGLGGGRGPAAARALQPARLYLQDACQGALTAQSAVQTGKSRQAALSLRTSQV